MSASEPVLELDAAELTYEEWFFLWAAFGQMPGAGMSHVSEWRKRSLGMTALEKQLKFKLGLEALLARGFIVQERDKDGKPKVDPTTQQPVYVGVGRIVSHVKSVNPTQRN